MYTIQSLPFKQEPPLSSFHVFSRNKWYISCGNFH